MPNTPSSKRLLSTGEVARLSGFSPSAILQWIRTGKLRSYSSPGGQHRVAPDDLLEFLDAHGMRVPPELKAERPRRVLVVEDDRAVREVLARILGVSGLPLEVATADSRLEGCIRMPAFRPDLVILDIEMPPERGTPSLAGADGRGRAPCPESSPLSSVDGVELCRWVKESEDFADTRLLLLASSPHDEALRLAMLAGADDWVLKPVRVVPFLMQVTRLLGLEPPTAVCDVARPAAASDPGGSPALPEPVSATSQG